GDVLRAAQAVAGEERGDLVEPAAARVPAAVEQPVEALDGREEPGVLVVRRAPPLDDAGPAALGRRPLPQLADQPRLPEPGVAGRARGAACSWASGTPKQAAGSCPVSGSIIPPCSAVNSWHHRRNTLASSRRRSGSGSPATRSKAKTATVTCRRSASRLRRM